jgi:hypothetical protein
MIFLLNNMANLCALLLVGMALIQGSSSFTSHTPISPLRQPSTLNVGFVANDIFEGETRSLEDELLSLAQISDDDLRRDSFESFLLSKMVKPQSGFRIQDLFFVEQVNDGLTRLGTAIQDQSWEKYVISGFEENAAVLEDKTLWACVDMLIQFKMLVKKLECNPKRSTLSGGKVQEEAKMLVKQLERSPKLSPPTGGQEVKAKNGNCGKCQICSCGKKDQSSRPFS